MTEEQAIEYAKSVDVHVLDASLPSQRLEDWLRSGSPKVDLLRWESDATCDIRPFGNSDYPRCVRIEFGRGGESGYLLVLIGTLHKGIIGAPQLYESIGVQEPYFIQTGGTERLSGLAHLLDQPTVAGGVNAFYSAIVQRHPLGIPGGADKNALWPFLSRRLITRLEAARACQANHLHQHPEMDAAAPPGWNETGIFTGNSKRAIPLSANSVHKEAQPDGSFDVTVNLTYVKLPGFVPDEAAWEVVARVIPEDGRFVIDDVRFFDGLDTKGPSHLLTDLFAGCEGGDWNGAHVSEKLAAPLPGPRYTDWDAINALRSAAYNEEVMFAKTVDVHELDASLPSQKLSDWLRPLQVTHVEWQALTCNIKEGGRGPAGEYLVRRNPAGGLCAVVRFKHGNARISVEVNSPSGGATASVKIYIADKDSGLLEPMMNNSERLPDSDRLSDLPRLLREQGVIDVTRALYNEVVARYPPGAPRGQDAVRMAPLLSLRLRKQLISAQACRNEALRRRLQPPNRPAWLRAGLFSGEGKLAFPTAALVEHKERQEDGSFQVRVSLSSHGRDASASTVAKRRWKTWHVIALVKEEEGKFAVDDVRLFDDDSTSGPFRTLSTLFTGCDGHLKSE